MKKVAVLGLGIVGSRVRENLIKAGYPVSCWSRTFRELDGETKTPDEAVEGADFISMYLKDVPMTREVFGKIKGSLKGGCILLNHSTINLSTTLWLAEQCREIGCKFLDAPFTGSKDAAAEGQLLYYLGGSEELIDEVRPVLQVSSKAVKRCGDIGAGTVVKLGTNLISASYVQAMSEALVIAEKNGVDPKVFADCAMANASGSKMMEMKYPLMLKGDFDAHFTMSNMLKDSKYAMELGESVGVDLPGISVVSAQMEMMCERGDDDLDYSALVKALWQNK